MKAERRHELQKNELADWLNKAIDDVRPYFKAILGVVIVAVAAAFAFAFVAGQRKRGAETAWREYYAAAASRDAEALRSVATRYPDSGAAAWALQSSGDTELAQGASLLYRDREEAEGRLEKAQRDYLKVLDATTEPMLLQRSLFGLAQAYESLNDLDSAKQRYEELAQKWPESTLAQSAQTRLADLSESSTRKFYSWFFAQEPPLASRNPPGSQTRSASRDSSIYSDLPDDPDLSLPDSLDLELPVVNPPSNEPSAPSSDGDRDAEVSSELPFPDETSAPQSDGGDRGATKPAADEDTSD